VRLLIGVVRPTRICSNEVADVIFGAGLDAVFGFAERLLAFFDFLVGNSGASLGVMVALRVTLLCKHAMSLCILRASSSLSLASGPCPRRSRELSASVSQMSVNSYLSGQCQCISENQCQRLNVRDSISETQCKRPDVSYSISETQFQSRIYKPGHASLQHLAPRCTISYWCTIG